MMMIIYMNDGHIGCDELGRQSFSSLDFRNIFNSCVPVAYSCNQTLGGQHICGVLCKGQGYLSRNHQNKEKTNTVCTYFTACKYNVIASSYFI